MLNILLFALLVPFIWASALPEAEPKKGGDKTIRVRGSESIQAAINTAPRGSRIVVDPGSYAEQLLVKTDGISLEGKGATLTPPESAVENECTNFAGPINPPKDNSPSQADICVAGSGVDLSDFANEHKRVNAVWNSVKSISISGFTVSGFSGFNILVIGGENVEVCSNALLDGLKYGFPTARSKNTKVSDNVITSKIPGFHFVGLRMINFYKVKVSKNKISTYYIGLCIHTNGAEIEDKEISDACYGAFLY